MKWWIIGGSQHYYEFFRYIVSRCCKEQICLIYTLRCSKPEIFFVSPCSVVLENWSGGSFVSWNHSFDAFMQENRWHRSLAMAVEALKLNTAKIGPPFLPALEKFHRRRTYMSLRKGGGEAWQTESWQGGWAARRDGSKAAT